MIPRHFISETCIQVNKNCKNIYKGIREYKNTATSSIKKIRGLADSLDNVAKTVAKVRIAAAAVTVASSIVAGILFFVGLLAAPVTGGASLTPFVIAASVAGGVAAVVDYVAIGIEEGITVGKINQVKFSAWVILTYRMMRGSERQCPVKDKVSQLKMMWVKLI